MGFPVLLRVEKSADAPAFSDSFPSYKIRQDFGARKQSAPFKMTPFPCHSERSKESFPLQLTLF